MPYLPKIEFANFHLTFGPDLNLLDLFSSVVYPAVADQEFERDYRETRYWFEDVALVQIDYDPLDTFALVGRLRKQLTVEIHADDLNADPEKKTSKESCLFVLLLDSHRLIFLHETNQAPGLRAFRSTFERAVADQRRELLVSIRDEFKATGDSKSLASLDLPNKVPEGRRPTHKMLLEIFPEPHLEVIPLGSEDSLGQFLNRFAKLQRVQFQFIKTNDELDNSELFNSLRSQGESLKSADSELKHENAKGLD
jgi:hypothetical protein